jgi:hypothetical protein
MVYPRSLVGLLLACCYASLGCLLNGPALADDHLPNKLFIRFGQGVITPPADISEGTPDQFSYETEGLQIELSDLGITYLERAIPWTQAWRRHLRPSVRCRALCLQSRFRLELPHSHQTIPSFQSSGIWRIPGNTGDRSTRTLDVIPRGLELLLYQGAS